MSKSTKKNKKIIYIYTQKQIGLSQKKESPRYEQMLGRYHLFGIST
jgi:hypothetical protein